FMMRKVAMDKRGTEGTGGHRRGWRKRRTDDTLPLFDPRDLNQVQPLIESIAPVTISNLRDRAILAVFAFAQASPDEVIGIKVKDYFTREGQQCLRLTENGRERIQ